MTAADLIKALSAAAIEEIEVRGVKLRIKGMTSGECIEMRQKLVDAGESPEPPAGYWNHDLVARYVVDAGGQSVFASADEVRDLIDAGIAADITERILVKSGMRAARETAAKNS